MPISTGSFSKALYPGVSRWYGQQYNEHKVEYPDLFDTFTSRRAWEEDVSVSGLGLLQVKGEGQSVSYDVEQQGYIDRYTHVTYALGFIITMEMMEDDLYDVVGERKARGLAFSARQTKEINAANVYNRAFNSSYTYGDGKELLATNHPNVAGGTWSNELTAAADISEAALEQACIDIGKWENDRGLNIAVMPQSIIVPVDLDFVVNKIMKTVYEVDTANNTMNVVRSRFPGGVKINHYLTDTDAWFIRTNAPNGMKYYERKGDTFTTDDDFDTENAKFKVVGRYSFGASEKRALFGSPGA